MELLLLLSVAFTAAYVWLTVRVINRRERRAKWTLAVMVVTGLFGYPLCIGPACWLMARSPGAVPERVMIAGGGAALRPGGPPNGAMSVYYPLLDFLRRNSYTRINPHTISIEQALYWWMRAGMPTGTEVAIPDPTLLLAGIVQNHASAGASPTVGENSSRDSKKENVVVRKTNRPYGAPIWLELGTKQSLPSRGRSSYTARRSDGLECPIRGRLWISPKPLLPNELA
jgi:hypothetical protein